MKIEADDTYCKFVAEGEKDSEILQLLYDSFDDKRATYCTKENEVIIDLLILTV